MLKVFLGEDDPTQAMYLERLLSKISQVETRVFGSGLDLYQAIQLEPPDFIISDNVLPKLDGLSVARLVKFHERTESIPFLVVSSIELEELEDFDQCGAEAFLGKPVRSQELKNVMEEFFGDLRVG